MEGGEVKKRGLRMEGDRMSTRKITQLSVNVWEKGMR